MPYRPSGCDRDSYISGVGVKVSSAFHNVDARRDNLPDNVFHYLKEQVAREQFQSFAAQEERARVQMAAGSMGKRMAVGSGEETIAEMKDLGGAEKRARRHAQLKQLYYEEMRAWETELNVRGIGIEKR